MYTTDRHGAFVLSDIDYIYQYKDHLGNIRLSYQDYNDDGVVLSDEIKEEKHYYPFGLQQKGYNNTIIGAENNYKTFQEQEYEEDLGKNTYAYQWRDYDPAIARFNKIDRFAEKYNPVSPYTFTANNPLKFIEVKGDSLQVANNKKSKEYLNSAAKKRNQKFIKYDKDGNVTLDFGDLSEKQVARRLKLDSGLSAINDLVNATNSDGKSEKYYFEVSFEVRGKIGDRDFTFSTESLAGKEITTTDMITNLSTTPRGNGAIGGKPRDGYDGAIFLTPGRAYDFSKSYRPLGTGGLVEHELRESYLRTNQKKTYKEAHESAGGQSSISLYRVDEKE